ncbi:hypothetical protein FQN60_014869 [Etheostoma spectabile]|uniref:Uncharacterized protein n=1 Tax=Etheostoma spectabile TaxID=54343 RepID=A0A5J5CWE5_9PERO|nr:hypothetical protein FQN60_014869 [Etheostoma spectabile]
MPHSWICTYHGLSNQPDLHVHRHSVLCACSCPVLLACVWSFVWRYQPQSSFLNTSLLSRGHALPFGLGFPCKFLLFVK